MTDEPTTTAARPALARSGICGHYVDVASVAPLPRLSRVRLRGKDLAVTAAPWTNPATCLSCMADFEVPDDSREQFVSRHGYAICKPCAKERGTTADPRNPTERVRPMS